MVLLIPANLQKNSGNLSIQSPQNSGIIHGIMDKATLVLQDGTVFEGEAFGASQDAVFELVFNTSMTGYQEILTDPSYRGQGVLFTASHIGNVGINVEDYESQIPQISAVVIRELSPLVSNWRASATLSNWLTKYDIPGISGVDTRYLTRKLREGGTQKAAISTRGTPATKLREMVASWHGLDGMDMVREVTCPEPYVWTDDQGSKWVPKAVPDTGSSPLIVVYDFGVKRNILRHLASKGATLRIVPADTPAHQVLALNPQGVFLSNGPGDPAGLPYAVLAVEQLINSGVPIFGICLGHQLIGQAMGGKTARLKFGHHGGNHPVIEHQTRKVIISAQNHNYHVLPESLSFTDVEITHTSLNDGTVEGLRLLNYPVYSVQFHPEAAPGPHDAYPLFTQFFDLIKQTSRA